MGNSHWDLSGEDALDPKRSVVGTDVLSLGAREPNPLVEMGKLMPEEGPCFGQPSKSERARSGACWVLASASQTKILSQEFIIYRQH